MKKRTMNKELETIGGALKRRSDGVLGTVIFQHSPRFYWSWAEDRV